MSKKLKEVASVFFKLGVFAFGGPAAHIAMMEDEVVTKRQWMTREHYLDLIGGTNLIPGPNSTEMTMHCGHEYAGKKGLFVAGICFIIPAVFITGLIAYFYTEYGALPEVKPFIKGIQPAVLAIIASAILKLGKKAIKNWELAFLGVVIVIACCFGVHEIIAMLLGGIIGMLYFYFKFKHQTTLNSFSVAFLFPLQALEKLSALKVFLTFLKVGSILYGSGYVLFAYLETELVSTGYLTQLELIDAIGMGQFTPGPVLSTATFIGYQLNGIWGALAATLGVFLPSFLFVLLLNPLIPRMRKSTLFGFFLDSVNVAAVAVMFSVLITMSKSSLVNWQAAVILVISSVLVFKFKKISVVWVIVLGALLGYILSFV